MNSAIRKYRWPVILAAILATIVVLAALGTTAPSQGANPAQGQPPPLTPPPVPTPTPLVLGNPTHLEAAATGHRGQVALWWRPAENATAHWVWSAKWDNSAGKWTSGEWDHATVGGLENGEDHWFRVIAGLERRNGEYEWSKWSNWAKAAPQWHPPPTDPKAGIGDVDVHITDGPNGPEAFAITPCDGPTAPVVPTIHGGGSPTGSSCIYGEGANFNLTPLVSSGHSFKIQMACINRSLSDCWAAPDGLIRTTWDIGFVERVKRRTDGQVQFEVTSFPKLGVSGVDSLRLIGDGALPAAQIYPPYLWRDPPHRGHQQPLGTVS